MYKCTYLYMYMCILASSADCINEALHTIPRSPRRQQKGRGGAVPGGCHSAKRHQSPAHCACAACECGGRLRAAGGLPHAAAPRHAPGHETGCQSRTQRVARESDYTH